MCQDGKCDHNHGPEARSMESDFMLHELSARQAQTQGKRRQFQKHALTALALAQRIHMRNAMERRLKSTAEGAEIEKLQNAARIAHSHGGYIRKAG